MLRDTSLHMDRGRPLERCPNQQDNLPCRSQKRNGDSPPTAVNGNGPAAPYDGVDASACSFISTSESLDRILTVSFEYGGVPGRVYMRKIKPSSVAMRQHPRPRLGFSRRDQDVYAMQTCIYIVSYIAVTSSASDPHTHPDSPSNPLAELVFPSQS